MTPGAVFAVAASMVVAGCSAPAANSDPDLSTTPGEVCARSVDAGSEGPATTGPVKLIEIDLTKQKLRAYEGGRLVHEFLVSTGKQNKTPTGDFRIWRKHRKKDMRVGLPVLGKYYELKDVPWIMYYFGGGHPKERGFAIHGAWWHSDFGSPASHGCINLSVEDARELFFWSDPQLGALDEVMASESNPGTRVVVFGSPPGKLP